MPLVQATNEHKDMFVRNNLSKGKYFFGRFDDTGELQLWYRDLTPSQLASVADEIGKVVRRRKERGGY